MKQWTTIIFEEVKEGIEETRLAKMVGLSQMGKLCSAANYLVGLVEGRLKPAKIPDPGSLWSSP